MLLNLPIILSINSFFILPIIPIFILFYSHLFYSPRSNIELLTITSYVYNTHSITLLICSLTSHVILC